MVENGDQGDGGLAARHSGNTGEKLMIVLYVLLAVFVGWLGRYKQIGFVGFLLLSLVLTPVITLFILMMAQDRRPRAVT